VPITTFRLLLFFGARMDEDLINMITERRPEWLPCLNKARIMMVLAAAGSIARLAKGRSALRVIPTDVLRTLSHFLFEKYS
jgi:hypothetical protein